jgi:cation/acetate symporter
MSAASFLGIAGLVALSGFDGLIYSIGLARRLAGGALPHRRAAAQSRQATRSPTSSRSGCGRHRCASRGAAGTLATIVFYLIAQMVGAGNLIRLLFGIPVRTGRRDRRRA